MGTAHDYWNTGVPDLLRVPISPDGRGRRRRHPDKVRRKDVVPVDFAEAFRIDANLVPALFEERPKERQTKAKLLDKAVYMKARSSGLDEGNAHADLTVGR